MIAARLSRGAVLLLIGLDLVLASNVSARPALPDRFDLGRDRDGDPCIAQLNWSVGGYEKVAGSQPYTIACRGVEAARAQGYVSPAAAPNAASPAGSPASPAACGAAKTMTMQGVGTAEVRQCFDPKLQAPVVDVRFNWRGRGYHGAAAINAVGPLEAALRARAGIAPPPAGPDVTIKPSLDVKGLADAPMPQSIAATNAYTPGAALTEGLTLIRGGDHVGASRVLNDAVSQFPDAPLLLRAELRLYAGLADSNIGQVESAETDFAIADELIATAPTSAEKTKLQSESTTCRALSLINQRRWADAVNLLDGSTSAADPLRDPALLSQLNQPEKGVGASGAMAAPGLPAALTISAQQDWARMIAYTALGQTAASEKALANAVRTTAQLQRRVEVGSLTWLRGGLERQRARLWSAENRIDDAIASYDCAILVLQGGTLPSSSHCLFSGLPASGAPVAATGPVIADTQIERASVLARKPGSDVELVLKDYEAAVDTLATDSAGGGAPQALGGYLDLLIGIAGESGAHPDVQQQYFRALQTAGEPGVARDFARLEVIAAADAGVGAKLRERADLDRRVKVLGYEIAAMAPTDQAAIDAREAERRTASAELAKLNTELQDVPALNDQPATINELRAALHPGELYWKLALVGERMFGIVLSADQTYIYALPGPAQKINTLTDAVIASLTPYNEAGQKRVHAFKVDAAYDLFRVASGPAAAALASSRAIIFDSAAGLRNLPASVFITDPASVAQFRAQKKHGDYSTIAFLGARAEISTAQSPRNFVQLRTKLVPSAAPEPFIGFGQNAAAPAVSASLGAHVLNVGSGCRVSYAAWADRLNQTPPINADEARRAAAAIGAPGSPIVTEGDFTDDGVIRMSDAGQLARYQVLHFATHGTPVIPIDLPGCEGDTLSPSLVTTIDPPQEGRTVDSDGFLSFDEIARLKLDANLVVLSACETSSSASAQAVRIVTGENTTRTLDGLVRAFIIAHARAVMATYWEVPDVQTATLIGEFYRLGRTEPIATALHDAQLALLRDPASSHPVFWGAFFIVGDGSRTMLTATRTAAVDRH